MKTIRWACLALPLLIFPSPLIAEELSILTGGTSGVYYPVGVKLKEVFEKEIPEHSFKVLSTQATVESLNLLQRGSGILALAQGYSPGSFGADDQWCVGQHGGREHHHGPLPAATKLHLRAG